MVYDHISNWRQYFSGPIWQLAFEHLEGLGPDAEEGFTQLQGEDVFARVMAYKTKTPEDAILEAHRKYIDIQMTLANAERIDWYSLDGLEVETPYDAEKDRTLFHRPAYSPAHVDNHPGNFGVFFPKDAHMPQLIVQGKQDTVRKVVVKVHAGLFAETP